MSLFYFTFGQSHKTKAGLEMKDHYVTVEAESQAKARELFVELFAKKAIPTPLTWAFQYSDADMQKQYFPKGEYCKITQGTLANLEEL